MRRVEPFVAPAERSRPLGSGPSSAPRDNSSGSPGFDRLAALDGVYHWVRSAGGDDRREGSADRRKGHGRW